MMESFYQISSQIIDKDGSEDVIEEVVQLLKGCMRSTKLYCDPPTMINFITLSLQDRFSPPLVYLGSVAANEFSVNDDLTEVFINFYFFHIYFYHNPKLVFI